MPRTKPNASPGLGAAAVPPSQETTTQRHSRRGNPLSSLTVTTAGETVAQSVAEAALDPVFAQNPNASTIGYSSTSEDDEESDDDDDSMTSNSNSMTSNSTGDDAEEDSSALRMLLIHTIMPNWWIANYWKMMSLQFLIVLIGLRERVLAESP